VIALSRGGLISRKNIVQAGNRRYEVFHGIDGTLETLSERELYERTNIGRAIDRGAFFAED
jgi:hypothetical protein